MAGALAVTFGFVGMVRGGEHWRLDEGSAYALAEAYVKVGKRLEPYMPAVTAKLGPLAIVADIAAAGAVTFAVVKPRLDADRQLARLRELEQAGTPPAGIHRESVTHLDSVRRTDGDTVTGASVAETAPHLVEETAKLGQEVGISPERVVELRHAMGDDSPLLDVIAPGVETL